MSPGRSAPPPVDRGPLPDLAAAAAAPLTRRQLLRLAGLAAAGAWASRASAEPVPADAHPGVLAFRNLHTGETISVPFRPGGRLDRAALREVAWVLRDHRTGEARPMDARLFELLGRLGRALDVREPYEVISGYRSRATNAMLAGRSRGVSRASLHVQGRAIDLRVPGRSLAAVRAAALALGGGGVGYYPVSGFVHVDVGRPRWWCEAACESPGALVAAGS